MKKVNGVRECDNNPIPLARNIEVILQGTDVATASAALAIAEVLFEHRIKGDAVAAVAAAVIGPETGRQESGI